MPDFDVEANRPILTDIADGMPRYEILARYPGLTSELCEAMAGFVHTCQKSHRKAWESWMLGDVEELHRLVAYYTPLEEVSQRLGRSERAVEMKWHRSWDQNEWENPHARALDEP